MSYLTSVKIFSKFENSLILDEISGSPLTYTGTTPVISAGHTGNALQMATGTSLHCSNSLGITNAFTIGFWLRPTYPGLAVSTAPAITPLKQALITEANFSYNSGTQVTTASPATFMIWETCTVSGAKTLTVNVNGTSLSATAVSGTYLPNVWHYFWIVYDGTVPRLRIYVDGTLSATVSGGSVPSTLIASSAQFAINDQVIGNGYEVTRNTGLLDEVFVMNTALDDTTSISRAANLGAEYVLDSSLTAYTETYGGAVMNDPQTIQVAGAASDNTDIYLGRSDGKLLRGYRALWQSRRTWASPNETQLVVDQYGTGNVAAPNGLLRTGVMIRT